MRAAAIDKNEITTEQVELLSDSLNTLEELHKVKLNNTNKCIQSAELGPLRAAFNAQTIAILKFELAKKRETVQTEAKK